MHQIEQQKNQTLFKSPPPYQNTCSICGSLAASGWEPRGRSESNHPLNRWWMDMILHVVAKAYENIHDLSWWQERTTTNIGDIQAFVVEEMSWFWYTLVNNNIVIDLFGVFFFFPLFLFSQSKFIDSMHSITVPLSQATDSSLEITGLKTSWWYWVLWGYNRKGLMKMASGIIPTPVLGRMQCQQS